MKDHIINKLQTTIGDLTSSELKSKDNTRKLINQNNSKENTNIVSINQSSTKIRSDNTQGKNDIIGLDKNNSMNIKILLNSMHERAMNQDENIRVKIQKYPGTSSIDILDHIKHSLAKSPDQIIIHAGTNEISNNINHLNNVRKIVKLVKETCTDTKLSFSSVIYCTNVKRY